MLVLEVGMVVAEVRQQVVAEAEVLLRGENFEVIRVDEDHDGAGRFQPKYFLRW